jgi:hypothetical protein
MNCEWPNGYLHITDALMRDQEKAARAKERHLIVKKLEEQLSINTTRTMTFTEDGLLLAIKIIEEIDK